MAKGDGEKIAIRFTEPLIGDISGNESNFDVSFDEYSFVPGGLLRTVHREVINVSQDESDDNIIYLHLASGNQNSIQNTIGDITVTYDGAGSLMGEGGPVAAFSESFTPEDLVFKGNQNNEEHIGLSLLVDADLIHIYYTNSKCDEHIGLLGLSPTAILTDIRDI